MKEKLTYLFLFITIVFGSGGYDHGTSAGKGNLDISLTWNPFSYFEHGQSYAILGYGLTKTVDFHAYYSYTKENNSNYYGGLFYQFVDTKNLDLATAIGIRVYSNNSNRHIFFPQLLYTIKLTDKTYLGGSFVDIRNQSLEVREGTAMDIFMSREFYESNNVIINFSVGIFSPVLWKPAMGKWYPTYSIDIKIK